MKTIAHFLSHDIKINQDYKYRQIHNLQNYRSIVIGDFEQRKSEEDYPFEYFYMKDIFFWRRFLRKQNIKAIHAHIGGDAVKILPLCVRYNIPLIVSFRGSDASAQKERLERNRLLYRDVMKHGRLYLPVCKFSGDELVKLGFPENKIKVLYGGIDVDKFTFREWKPKKDKSFQILSIGRLAQNKGFSILIQAFRIFHNKFPKSKLIIIGHGKGVQRKAVMKEIKKYGLETCAVVKKPIKNRGIAKELHRADFFCLPSFTTENGDIEGIPNVLKEAMACGVPVVSTFHAGIPELIEHKKTGLLVKEKDVDSLAKALIQLCKSPKRCKKYVKRARQKVENDFNLNKQIMVQEQYYDLAIQGG